MNFSFDALSEPADLPTAAKIIAQAFASPEEGCSEWLTKHVGLPNARVLRTADDVVATGVRIPMGQFFGGRSVAMTGIAGIAVAPAARSKGVGRALMRELITEIHREGTPLSSLYPATTTLYRRMGFEQAGQHLEHRFPATRLSVAKSAHSVRPYTAADLPGLKHCYQRFAMHSDGALDRGEYIWDRVFVPRNTPAIGFIVEDPTLEGGVGGYVFLHQVRPPNFGRHEVHITDMVANTLQAAMALLNFVHGYGSMAEDIVFRAGIIHPIFSLIDEPRYLKLEFKDYWMMRITHVANALAARGYPAGLTQRLELEVADDLLEGNCGRWTLSIDSGNATVTPGGAGSFKIDIRGLAQLYSGQFHPHAIAVLGRLQAPDSALAAATAVFGSSGGTGFCDFF
ncbi:MAG: GNAT family N-acetyltransferase [Planctomycetota bacterium]|nr:GNAT family N-acetyltransferase [Planctomycetota bacterium]